MVGELCRVALPPIDAPGRTAPPAVGFASPFVKSELGETLEVERHVAIVTRSRPASFAR